MIRKIPFVVVVILSLVSLVSCNLPQRQVSPSATPTMSVILPQSSPTPTSLCTNQYFPNAKGDTWEYSGSNTLISNYSRIDTVTASSTEAFTVESNLAGVVYSLPYTCSPAGILATNPVQEYAGALLNSPNAPIKVELTSNEGVSLPSNVVPGDTWQQSSDFNATAENVNISGRFVFDYTATGYEQVTVPAGSYNALRVDATIRIEVSGFRILAGTYTTSTWMVAGIGVVKSEGTSHVPGVDFTDGMQLTKYTPSP